MLNQFELRTDDMPSEMRTLLADYPRDDWEGHPGFKERTRQWMGAHQMFRRLGGIIGKETELYLDKSQAPDAYAERLSYYGDALIRNLHGHHHWEDDNYFPELSAADSRFDAGLEILEKDHQALDIVLDSFTRTANRTIKLIQLDEVSAREEAGTLLKTAETIEAFLQRHLSDEEELAVPIILHHRLRG
ncbi:hemerythrin domain-containing protein [Pararhizobium sp. IMCC21322]|uniref:hemerythrin domain-containing protein n=1 Tax=Pararhizobium sp. IMCC21322 TaxID=3067903 RepID=UPI002742094A|nr:hemerythrin domain-containing protein [Pararhizobium sp. IMCC21322]